MHWFNGETTAAVSGGANARSLSDGLPVRASNEPLTLWVIARVGDTVTYSGPWNAWANKWQGPHTASPCSTMMISG